ncbi:lipopolysaccharide biosynthesis protein [Alteromonas sp. KUL106]|uniref:lipopolysaccharide biosynthesis protein n=1 Tax=Alteromonas sp. KUL106 TaxID=2480799 RepID=UPI0012E60C1B|nr:lipopolysaccharide biosynthesis protein [Alteromonas sp. KUL106]GFD68753.1 lipopolysaccharide biosynthesis protein [Alteromonas sp. KUL106]
MDKSKNNSAVSALKWTSALQVATQAFNFTVGIILARLLTPEDFGLVAMVLVFVALAQVFSDFGLSSAIIQKDNDPTPRDYSTAMSFSLLLGFTVASLLYFCSENLANFYHQEKIALIAKYLSLVFVFNSLTSVPKAKLSREINHKLISMAEMVSSVVAMVSAIALAYLDFGYWSLVAQQVILALLRLLIILRFSRLPIRLKFYSANFKPLFSFSVYVFLTQCLRQTAVQSDKLVVGKFLDSASLGLYTRAYQLMLFPINNISRVLANVMFPVMSKMQNDKQKVASVYLKVVRSISFITFPLMLGLMVVAEDFVVVIYGEAWRDMGVYLSFFCLIGLVMSIATITGSIYLALGMSKLQFKINIINQPLQIIGFLIGIQFGIEGLFIGYFTAYLLSAMITWWNAFRILEITYTKFLLALSFPSVASIAMVIAMLAGESYLSDYVKENYMLLTQCVIGAIFYGAATISIQPKAFNELKNTFF